MAYIQSYPNQNYLIPPKITDLFSKDHVCYLIERITDSLDYCEFDEKYAGAGHPAYLPRIILKLLMMAHVDGVRSSRRIAKNCQENVVYIYLAEKLSPDFRTISDFRKDNAKLVKNAFLQINKFALKHGLIDLSHLMIDGSPIKANANDDIIINTEIVEKLEKYVDRLVEEGIQTDKEEDKLYGDRGMHELPKEFNDSEKKEFVVKRIVEEINNSMKQGKIEEVKKEINDLKQKVLETGVGKYSFTDSESRFMRNKKGYFELSYNAQVVTDKNGLIISNDVVQTTDRRQLLPNIERVEEEFGELPEGTKILADGLYISEDILKLNKFDLYIPTYGMQKISKNRFDKLNFKYDEQNDRYICPENKILKPGKKCKDSKYEYSKNYVCKDCPSCIFQKQCAKNNKYRKINTLPHDKIANQIKEKMQTREGKTIYKLRMQTIEPAFGDLKQNKKFTEFLLRGLEKVKTELNLACIASNLVKINNILKNKNQTITKISAVTC